MSADVALMAARLFAVDPSGLGGVLLQAGPGEVRDDWLRLARDLLPPATPWRRLPLHITDERLLGGLDLAATLAAGRAVSCSGLLAQADGGVVVLAMAERIEAGVAARIAGAMDRGTVATGQSHAQAAVFAVVALDESRGEDERVPRALGERLALHVQLAASPARPPSSPPTDRPVSRDEIAAARERLPHVVASEEIVTALCQAAMALGIDSLRTCCLALRVARIAAALRASREVDTEDIAWAGGLVLGPRARAWPAGRDAMEAARDAASADDAASDDEGDDPNEATQTQAASDENIAQDPGQEPDATSAHDDASGAISPASLSTSDAPLPDPHADPDRHGDTRAPLDEAVVAAAAATLPSALLRAIAASTAQAGCRQPVVHAGRSGAARLSFTTGRPVGSVQGEPRGRARLDLLQTLRAAAPWQTLRRRERDASLATPIGTVDAPAPVVLVRRADFHVRRYRPHPQSTTIFAVDASGSQALHRLAEAKGAVELLLADCYVRRDRVAVLAFRGTTADVLLPPTRSLVRAKRCLAGLPGGGGTPLASGIDAARSMAQSVAREGGTPLLVLLTDGKANIARDGKPGRPQAQADAAAAARAWRAAGLAALLLDTAPEPQPLAGELAQAMNARYVALPYADAHVLAKAVTAHRSRIDEKSVGQRPADATRSMLS